MSTRTFRPCLSINKKNIPFYMNMTNNELRIAKLLKKVANENSTAPEELALKYYHLVLDKYNDLAYSRFFKSYAYRIIDKYNLVLELPNYFKRFN